MGRKAETASLRLAGCKFQERPLFKVLRWKVMAKDAVHVCIGVCTHTYMCIYNTHTHKKIRDVEAVA